MYTRRISNVGISFTQEHRHTDRQFNFFSSLKLNKSKSSGLVNIFTLVLPLVRWWCCCFCLFLWRWSMVCLTTVVAVEAVEAVAARRQRWRWRWWQWMTIGGRAASNKSVNGHMTACNDESGQQTTTQQPTNNESSKGGQWWWWQWWQQQQRQWWQQWWQRQRQRQPSEVALCPLLPWYCVKLSRNVWFRDS